MLEHVLSKPESTTMNELNYEHSRAQEQLKNESMFLATGTKFSHNTHQSHFFMSNKSGAFGLTSAKKEYENPVFELQEKYMQELDSDYHEKMSIKKVTKFSTLHRIRLI